jgi:hypothetical protein
MRKRAIVVMSLCVVIAVGCSKDSTTTSEASSNSEPNTGNTVSRPEEEKGLVLELFGVKLHGADRVQLRKSIKDGGMTIKLENDNSWIDTYNPGGALEGATSFEVGYVMSSRKFSYAEYKFSSFMDNQQVGKIAKMVSMKYGEPTSASGNENLGPVSYQWDFPNNMFVRVSRGWPDTTTYLSYADSKAYTQMQAEQSAQQNAQDAQKANSQSQAF